MSDSNASSQDNPTGQSNPANPTGKARRTGLYLPFALLGLVCVLWTGFWLYSANKAGQIADNFISREAERGREWVCPNRSLGGFPFRLVIACERPQLLLKKQGEFVHEGSLGALALHARILSPGHFIAVMTPPFKARKGNVAEVEMSWKSANASFRAGLQGVSEADLSFEEPSWAIGQGDKADIKALAKGIQAHLRRSPGEVPGTDLVAKVDDFTFAPLDMLTGSPEPIKLELQATAPGFLPDPRHRFFDTLEAWRESGQQARIVLLKATKGAAMLTLTGALRLDDEHRPEGALSGRAKGLEALTARFTRRSGIDIGSILGKLGGEKGMPIALNLGEGVMRYGPIPILKLEPLY